MEKWIKDAKERARTEAEDFCQTMRSIAEELDLDPEWFIEEVLKEILKTKGDG